MLSVQISRATHAPLIKSCDSHGLLGRASIPYPLGNAAGKQERSIPPFALEFWQKVGVVGCCWRSPECLYQSFAVIWLFTERKDSLWHPCPPGLLLQSCLDIAFFVAHLTQWHWLCCPLHSLLISLLEVMSALCFGLFARLLWNRREQKGIVVGGAFTVLIMGFFPGTARNTLSQPNVWLAIFLSITLCVLPVVGFRFLKTQLKPTPSDKVRSYLIEPEILLTMA